MRLTHQFWIDRVVRVAWLVFSIARLIVTLDCRFAISCRCPVRLTSVFAFFPVRHVFIRVEDFARFEGPQVTSWSSPQTRLNSSPVVNDIPPGQSDPESARHGCRRLRAYVQPPHDDPSPGGAIAFLGISSELRKRIIRSLIAVAVGAVAAFLFINRIFTFLMEPTRRVLPAGSCLDLHGRAPSSRWRCS